MGYDCVMIPGASKFTAPVQRPVGQSICGNGAGLVTATGGVDNTKTVCSKFNYVVRHLQLSQLGVTNKFFKSNELKWTGQ
jgi:hypothetical protein